jgi:hypothetical protein
VSYLDDVVYRHFWHGTVTPATTEPTPAEPEPVHVASPLLHTTYEETRPEVEAAELAVSGRLADLVEEGLSPLEAARKLFIEEGA